MGLIGAATAERAKTAERAATAACRARGRSAPHGRRVLGALLVSAAVGCFAIGPDAAAHPAAGANAGLQAAGATATVGTSTAASAYRGLFAGRADPQAALALAHEALDLLRDAASHGLDPRDYDVRQLSRMLADLDALAADPVLDAAGIALPGFAALDRALTRSFLRLLSDVGRGRVAPLAGGYVAPYRRLTLDEDALLALARESPARAFAAVEPGHPWYRALRRGLEQLRTDAATRPADVTRLATGRVLEPGERGAEVPALRRLLAARASPSGPRAVDDADAASPGPDATRYDAALVAAVRAFQARHGLVVDGIVGPRTRAALAVSPQARIRQVELALERLRWLPPAADRPHVLVDVPQFRLWIVAPDQAPAQWASMPVIVGKPSWRTPIFHDAIRALEVNPYWNVPRSIASRELYPRSRRDPRFLARERIDLLGADGLEGAALRAALASGAARLRQRPGPGNALGAIKFVMSNGYGIFLHDTPARALFERDRRAFSHGCVRVADPEALVQFVLARQPDEAQARLAERVAHAQDTGRNRWVTMPDPLPVIVSYSTVGVASDGSLRYAPDVYGHDARLERALAAQRG